LDFNLFSAVDTDTGLALNSVSENTFETAGGAEQYTIVSLTPKAAPEPAPPALHDIGIASAGFAKKKQERRNANHARRREHSATEFCRGQVIPDTQSADSA
jgi:hypothetical protein